MVERLSFFVMQKKSYRMTTTTEQKKKLIKKISYLNVCIVFGITTRDFNIFIDIHSFAANLLIQGVWLSNWSS